MASQQNSNPAGGIVYDAPMLFRPSTTPIPPSSSYPNPQNMANNDNTNASPTLISPPFLPTSASYPPPSATGGIPFPYLPQTSSFYHHPMYNALAHPREFSNVHPQSYISYPTPALLPQVPSTYAIPQNTQTSPMSQNPNNDVPRMATLSAPLASLEIPQESTQMPQINPTSFPGVDFSSSQNLSTFQAGSNLLISQQVPVMRLRSRKLPQGRHLTGDHLVYDIDIRFPGEVQPQLEVTPITKYGSDPGLVLGRQIAVNKTYICYGLKLGAIRVLNINTALRSLLKGLSQRVTDMVFFAEDAHLLASASVDGRVYVWKITEGSDEENKQQITGQIVIAIQITGYEESVHPRVCWHCHKQEVLVVGIGKHVLKIDTMKAGKGERFSAEEPLKCSLDKLIDGVQLIGSHDGEVTDLSMCQWMTTRLVSASVDGTIKIWADRNPLPIAVLQPHGGQPVSSVTFLAAPHHPDHIILITGGPLNRELRIWLSASEDGWLLPVDAESWHCTQSLELKSSEARPEEVFFNQVLALSHSGLLLLANAKKKSIYAVHLDYGPSPAATRMDYIAEFNVTMGILSFTGMSEPLPHGEHIVQVYCVQTQAIQQYALDLSQCMPPAMGSVVYENSDLSISSDTSGIGLSNLAVPGIKPTEIHISSSAPKASVHESGLEHKPARYPDASTSADSSLLQELASSSMESKPVVSSIVGNNEDLFPVTSLSLPLSPRISRTLSDFPSPAINFEHDAEPKIVEYSVDRQMDAVNSCFSDVTSVDDNSINSNNKYSQDDVSMALNLPVKFRHPTHLVTPSEILMANSSSEVMHSTDAKSVVELNIHDVVISNDERNSVLEVTEIDETRFNQGNDTGSDGGKKFTSEDKQISFCSQASELGIEMAREFPALSAETCIREEDGQFDRTVRDTVIPSSNIEEKALDFTNYASMKVAGSSASLLSQQSGSHVKGKKQKGKSALGSGPSSPSPNNCNSTDSFGEKSINYGTSVESQILSMQAVLNQLATLQKEMHKQMITVVTAPVSKEGKRLEGALGRSMEKIVKANADALWARLLEENVKQEKTLQERLEQVTNMISGFVNKDLPVMVEKTLKRELSAIGQSVARAVIPTVEKAISTSIAESFQKGVGDKAVYQLEKSVNSRLEAAVARQIQAQFQTSGKQALQDTLKSTLEVSMIPAFDMSCRAMFEQVDASFHKGMAEHTAAAQQQFESSQSSLALALREAINSISSVSQSLSNELLDGQRKLVGLAISGANSKASNPLINQLNNGLLGGLHEKIEVDPIKELSRLISERKYEEAFTSALQRSDVAIVSWLCSQVDLPTILIMNPLPLSQGVFLSLLQQLACDIGQETPRKLTWMREILTAINPTDSVIAVHIHPIFEQVYQIMNHQRNSPTSTGSELSNIRLIMHVINSMLMTSK